MKANEEVGINPIIDVDKMDWTRVEAISKTLNPPEPEPPTPEPILPTPEPKPQKEKEMNILHWLFGKNSFWQRHPLWARFLAGVLIGLILSVIL
jgi:hypothetical protein